MQKYTKAFSAIHWIHALFIALALLGGLFSLSELPKTLAGVDLSNYQKHMIIGIIVLFILIVRIILLKKQPQLPPLDVNKTRELIIEVNHKLLYVFIGFTALSGMALAKSSNLGEIIFLKKDPNSFISSNLTEIIAQIHSVSAYILLGLIIMHVAGVISYILKGHKDILQRVWF
jgi:cytochrome b561